jgi:hypothetical protein
MLNQKEIAHDEGGINQQFDEKGFERALKFPIHDYGDFLRLNRD